MEEPTHRQHKILESISLEVFKKDSDPDIELYWELVRAGYLKNLVTLGTVYDWKFKLTDKAAEYLKSFQ